MMDYKKYVDEKPYREELSHLYFTYNSYKEDYDKATNDFDRRIPADGLEMVIGHLDWNIKRLNKKYGRD